MAKKKKRKPARKKALKTWLIPHIRKISVMWWAKNEAKKQARVERGKYECAMCHEIFGPREIDMDHIVPVIDPKDQWVSWDYFIESLFVPPEGYQCLCKPCHKIKTDKENELRKQVRDELKKD